MDTKHEFLSFNRKCLHNSPESGELSADDLFSEASQKRAPSTEPAQTDPFKLKPWKNVPGPKGPRKRAPDEAWCKVKSIPTSVKKMTPVCKVIRGLTYYEARTQMQLSLKGSAPYVLKALDSARANAEHNHGIGLWWSLFSQCSFRNIRP